MNRSLTLAILVAISAALAACSSGTPSLMNLRNTESGPDEFSVLPTRPLEMPASRSELPAPTPGGANLADVNPEADAIAALGGNIARAQGGGGDLVTYASRFGVSADIRSVLAAEDLEFRSRNRGRVLERVAGNNTYFQAYRRMALDRYAELARLRAAGVRTPSAPPEDQ